MNPLENISPAPDATSTSVMRFLVAEDNRIIQEVAKAMLESLYRCEIDIVDNGREAVRAWSGSCYNLILMDCQMPVMDGYQATGIIREGEQRAMAVAGRSPHTIIIAMTGDTTADARSECLEAGMDDYLAKPITLKQMKDILDRWLPELGG